MDDIDTVMSWNIDTSLVSRDSYVLDSATNNVATEDGRQDNTVKMVQLSC